MVRKINKLGGKSVSSTMQTLNSEIEQFKCNLNSINEENTYLKNLLQEKSSEIVFLKKEKESLASKELKNFEKKFIDWYELIEQEINKNTALSLENHELLNQLEFLKIENDRLLETVEDVKHHLSYTLGKTIVQIQPSFRNILSTPKKILDSYKKYYDYKLIKNNSLQKIKKSQNNNKKNNILSCIPLRYGEKEVYLNADYLASHEIFKISIDSVRHDANSGIKCEIILQSGNLEINDRILNKKVILTKNNSYAFNLSVMEGQVIELFDVISCGKDVELLTKWSKVSGKAVLLKLNRNSHSNFKQVNLVKEENRLQYTLPLKPNTHLLMNANEILNKFGKEAALDYFEKYSSKRNAHTIHILRANIFHSEEKVWLNELNKYLYSYGLEKVELKTSENGRYLNIDSELPVIKNSNFLVTVIMPAYNAEKTILKAINSILNQTWSNIELIVVNDCSTDNTRKILESIQDKRVKVINNLENVGAYVSKNIALKYANGTYITGHDSDDWAHPRRIENHIKEIKKNNNPRASITKMIRMDKNGYFSHIGKEGTFSEDGALRIASITCMFERDFLINKLGAWDSVRMGADSEIIARAKILLGDEFKTFNLLSMICLDAEGSLTNDPIHGVSKVTGISQTRKSYRDSWLKWHESLKSDTSKIKFEFPLIKRPYEVPQAMDVNINNILRNLK